VWGYVSRIWRWERKEISGGLDRSTDALGDESGLDIRISRRLWSCSCTVVLISVGTRTVGH
jgi:hypothetical protein